MSALEKATARELWMAISLLQLHFYNHCIQDSHASVLLNDSAMIVSYKMSGPNMNSIRGFKVRYENQRIN